MINLAITCSLVLLVGLASIILRECRPLPKAVPVAMPEAVTPATEAAAAKTEIPRAIPVERPASDLFQTFRNAKLLDSPTNEADTLHIQVTKGEEHVFVLYYVDALDATPAHPDRIKEQAAFFGKASPTAVVEAGREAYAHVHDLLNKQQFLVMTRWEKVPNTDRYYAMIRVEYEQDKWGYLADLLMRQGYARVSGVQTPLPDNTPSVEAYLSELLAHGSYAQKKKLGIWSMVK